MTTSRLSSRWRATTARMPPNGPEGGAGAAMATCGRGRRPPVSIRLPRRCEHDRLLGRVVSADLCGDRPLVHDEDPIGHGEDFGQVAGDEDDGQARRGQLRDDPMDLDLCPDVDAARRLVEDEHPRLGGEPLAGRPLLVATGQRRDELIHPVVRICSWSAYRRAMARSADPARTGEGRAASGSAGSRWRRWRSRGRGRPGDGPRARRRCPPPAPTKGCRTRRSSPSGGPHRSRRGRSRTGRARPPSARPLPGRPARRRLAR